MRGEYNGLKILILKENCCAFYIHCFAHQVQLALVTLVEEALKVGEITSVRGLNQETEVKKAGDTRWSSHYGTLFSIVSLFSHMIDVFGMIEEDGTSLEKKGDAKLLLKCMQSFEFIFILSLMKKVLSITHKLSQALQRSDQDIVNVMKLVKMSKQKLQTIRDSVVIPNMDDTNQTFEKSKRNSEKVFNLHYFQVQFFYQVIDRQLEELNNRFSEVNTELLLCVACLSPRDSFSALNVCSEDAFFELEGIGDLSIKMVEKRKHIVYPLVYLLLKLSLILHVATAERAFSSIKIIMSELQN
ncbi:general transcription factor-like zinc finger protein, putative [Medicago truncatula]|uniref:General transcription factor-like zinc finger protein, putative n=1 Tax=Medicago truncatula TaxID=3880 RepID=G7IIX5_MEDTR|nr:general transcription factor-like zinc finger protein, putative [Medicago truncatula]